MKIKSLIVTLALLLLLGAPLLQAETPAEKEARMKWFNEARFGMFIHWGVYSGSGGNIKGKSVPGAGEWLQSGGKIPAAEYCEELLPNFNPLKYDPEAWVIAAKNAGIKYLVITIDQLVTRPAKVTVLGHNDTPEISGTEGAWEIRLPEGSLQQFATVLALEFPAKPEIQAAAKP